MLKYVTTFLLLTAMILFSQIRDADIGYRTGMVSGADLEIAGHNGIYFNDGTEAIIHWFSGDIGSGGYHPDGINYENQTYEIEIRDYDGSGDNERYLGAKKYINISEVQREDIIAEALEILSLESADETVQVTFYDDLHNNPKGYDDDGVYIYEMDCVGFIEYLYESVGLNPTPDDEEYTTILSVDVWHFFPDEQYNSTNLEFSESPEPNGLIIFISDITIDPEDNIEPAINGFNVTLEELDDHNWFGDIELIIEKYENSNWVYLQSEEESFICDPLGRNDISINSIIESEGFYRARFSYGSNFSPYREFTVDPDLSGYITLSYDDTTFDWDEVGVSNSKMFTLSSMYKDETDWNVTVDPPAPWLSFTSTSGKVPELGYAEIEFMCNSNNELTGTNSTTVTIAIVGEFFKTLDTREIIVSQLPEPPEDCLVIDNTSFPIDYNDTLPKSIIITSSLDFDTSLTISIDPSTDVWITNYPTSITVPKGESTTINFNCFENDGISRNCNIILTADEPYFDGETEQIITIAQGQDPDLNGVIRWNGINYGSSITSNQHINLYTQIEESSGTDYSGFISVDITLLVYRNIHPEPNGTQMVWEPIQNIVTNKIINVDCPANSEVRIDYYTPLLDSDYNTDNDWQEYYLYPDETFYQYEIKLESPDAIQHGIDYAHIINRNDWELKYVILEENSLEIPFNYNTMTSHSIDLTIDTSHPTPNVNVTYEIIEKPQWIDIVSGTSGTVGYVNPVIKVGEYSESNSQPGKIKILLSDHGTFEGQSREAVLYVTQSNEPPIPEIKLSGATTFDVGYNESNIEFTVNKCDPDHPNQSPVSYNISNISNWIQVINGGTGVVPETTELKINKHFVDFEGRTGQITLSSESPFVGGNTITINQSACIESESEDLKPQLAVFDNTNKFIHYDPEDSKLHTIKTNVIEDFNSADFIAITACDIDEDGIDEQALLHRDDSSNNSIIFYKLGEQNFTKRIFIDPMYNTETFMDIESIDVTNDGDKEIIIVSKNILLVYDVNAESQINSYDLTSESLQDKIAITSGDYNSDGINDISITNGEKIVTLSINNGNIWKVIPDYTYDFNPYYFRGFTSTRINNNDVLCIVDGTVDSGIDPKNGYFDVRLNEITFDQQSEVFILTQSVLALYPDDPLYMKNVRSIVSGDFIIDGNNEYEYAVLHSIEENSDTQNVDTPIISIVKLSSYSDGFELIYQIDASDYIDNYQDLTVGQFYLPDVLKVTGTLSKSDKYFAKQLVYTEDETIVEESVNVDFISGDKINLYPGFKAEQGSNFKAKIDGVSKNSSTTNIPIINDDSNQKEKASKVEIKKKAVKRLSKNSNQDAR